MSFNTAIELTHTLALSDGDAPEYDAPGVFLDSISLSHTLEIAGVNSVTQGSGIFTNSIELLPSVLLSENNFSLTKPLQTSTLGLKILAVDLAPEVGDTGQIIELMASLDIPIGQVYREKRFRYGDVMYLLRED